MMRLRDFVLFTLLFPGCARRIIRVDDSHNDPRGQTNLLTGASTVPAESQEGGFWPVQRTLGGTYTDAEGALGRAKNELARAKEKVDNTKKAQNRIFRTISTLAEEETDTQAELDKTSRLKRAKRHKLKNALKELKAEIGTQRQLAQNSVDEHSTAMQRYADKAVAAEAAQAVVAAKKKRAEAAKAVAAAAVADTWKKAASEQSAEVRQKKKNPNLLKQLIKFGVAGLMSYAVWEGGFWKIYTGFGQASDPSNQEDVGKVGPESFAFVNLARFAIPLRIGLALGNDPWVDEDVLQRFGLSQPAEDTDLSNFAEDFKVVDESGVAVQGLDNTKVLLKWLTDTPLNTGSGIKTDRVYKKSPLGEPTITSNWHFELQESHINDQKVIEELKKSFDFPLQVAGSSTFNLNEDGKVEQMRVGSWSINDQVIPDLVSLVNFKELSEPDEGEEWQSAEYLVN